MLSEQMLNNMTLSELIAYSETFSDVPARVAQALTEMALETLREAEEKDYEIEALQDELEKQEHENDRISSENCILEATMKAARKEVEKENPDIDTLRVYLEE